MKIIILSFLLLSNSWAQANLPKPSEVKTIVDHILQEFSDDEIAKFLSPKQTKEIEWYIAQNDSILESQTGTIATPAAAASGAAAGAAAAIADYVWEKVVGKGKNIHQNTSDHYFDLEHGSTKNIPPVSFYAQPIFGESPQYALITTGNNLPAVDKFHIDRQLDSVDHISYLNPIQSTELQSYLANDTNNLATGIVATPAAAAGGAAAAIAYKVVECVLGNFGKVAPNSRSLAPNESHFDL